MGRMVWTAQRKTNGDQAVRGRDRSRSSSAQSTTRRWRRVATVGAVTLGLATGSTLPSVAVSPSIDDPTQDHAHFSQTLERRAPVAVTSTAAASSTSASNAVMLTANQIHFFAISSGSNPRLRHFWRAASGAGKPQSDIWAPGVKMAPVRPTAIAWGDNQYAFSITAAGQLQASSWSPGSGLVTRPIAGGIARIEPSAMLFQHPAGHQLHAFAVGTNGELRHAWRDASRSAAWKSDSWGRGQNGEQVTGRPISYAWGTQQHVFATCGSRAVVKVCHWWWENSGQPKKDVWVGPDSKVQLTPRSDVTGFSWGREQHILFNTRTQTGQTKVSHVWWDSGFKRIDSDTWPQVVSGAPQAVILAGNRQAVVSRSPRGVIVQTWSPSNPNRVASTTLSSTGSLQGIPSIIANINNMTVMGRDSSNSVRTWVGHYKTGKSTSGTWLSNIKIQS